MKTTDKIILLSGLLFGILFYEQAAGINYFIFSLVQALTLYFSTPRMKKNRNWWLVFSGVNLSALAILLYGASLGVWANVISLFVLANLSIEPRSSLVISIFHSFYTLFSGLVHVMTDIMAATMEKSAWKAHSRLFKNMVIGLVSLLIALIFILLYRNSNVAFKELTDKIDLSFISAEWIIFTAFGYYLVYLMYRPRNIETINKYDLETDNELDQGTIGITAKWMSLKSEHTWARTLLTMLNIVLMVVLISELTYELGVISLNDEVGYSENVHQGINALIFSIVLAVAIILFFFQGRLNFISENKYLKTIALIWVFQNVALIFLTLWKNWLYIEELSLTYRRIGVFVYLVCCLIGLCYTYIKVTGAKSNWFLVRKVGWTIYAVLIFTPLINWDYLIIEYNFSRAAKHPTHLDVDYLLELPSINHPLVFEKLADYKDYFPDQWDDKDWLLEKYHQETDELDWRSFNFRSFYANNKNNNKDEISYAN